MRNIYADLHSHTTFSDGRLTYQELSKKAKDKGIGVLSITDHDSIYAYKRSGYEIELFPGVELTVKYGKKEFHLLAYNFDPEHKELNDYLDGLFSKREERAEKILNQINEKRPDLTFEELKKLFPEAVLTRSHIADLIINKGYTRSPYDVYTKIINPKKINLPSLEVLDLENAIKLIRKSGGFCSLAHPSRYYTQSEIYQFIRLGMRGIEVWHPSHTRHYTKRHESFAKQYQLVKTGGSDFHGRTMDEERNFGHYGLSEEQFLLLKSA